jgi:O-antigen ligase
MGVEARCLLPVMTPRFRIRRRRSTSRHGHKVKPPSRPIGLAALITTSLLAVVLIMGLLFLGAARLWIELPLLGVVAFLLAVQGLRLTAKPAADTPRRADAIDLSVALFVLYAIVRWLTSPAEYFSRIEAMDVVAYAGVFFVCRYGMANRTHGMALLYLLVILGVGETAFGYYLSNHLDWLPFGPAERLQLHYAPRWVGTYESPNHYASLLVMAIGAALALGSFSKLAWPLRIVFYYVSLVMMVGVMYSGSRGSWVALLAAIVALVILGIRNGTMRWWVPVTGAAVLIVASGFLFSLSPVVRERLANTKHLILGGKLETAIHVRLAADALRIAHDHPFFGTGPGTFVFIHPRYQDSTLAFQADLTHDDYLNCLDDYGLVGFGLALFFIGAVTLKFFRPLVLDNRWQDRVLIATGLAAWVALLVHSLVDFNLHIPANALLLFSLTGMALGRVKEEKAMHWSTLSLAPLGRWLGGGVIFLSLIYGAQAARTTLSDMAYEDAFAHQDEVPFSESIAGAEKALDYDRGNALDLVFLGDLHRYQASRQKDIDGRLGEGQKALDAYQKALQANTLDDGVQVRMGMTLDLMQKYPEALPRYQRAVTDQPYNGQFWYWLGNHYAESGMADKAEQAYAQAEQYAHNAEENAEAEKQLGTLSGNEGGIPEAQSQAGEPAVATP